MPEITNITYNAVEAETAESFRAARKRLREARMRWIDENEAPQMMAAVDRDGNPVKMPFTVGKIVSGNGLDWDKGGTAGDDFRDEKYKDAKAPAVPTGMTLDDVERDLDETIREYMKLEGLDVSPGKPGELAFVSDARRRVSYPAKEEGESDEAYCLRVRDTYAEGPRGAAQAGRPGAGVDGVRRPGGDDPGDGRAAHADGAGDGGHAAAADLDCEPGADGAAPAGGRGGDSEAVSRGAKPATSARATAAGGAGAVHPV